MVKSLKTNKQKLICYWYALIKKDVIQDFQQKRLIFKCYKGYKGTDIKEQTTIISYGYLHRISPPNFPSLESRLVLVTCLTNSMQQK